jgi:hypothetical protein
MFSWLPASSALLFSLIFDPENESFLPKRLAVSSYTALQSRRPKAYFSRILVSQGLDVPTFISWKKETP